MLRGLFVGIVCAVLLGSAGPIALAQNPTPRCIKNPGQDPICQPTPAPTPQPTAPPTATPGPTSPPTAKPKPPATKRPSGTTAPSETVTPSPTIDIFATPTPTPILIDIPGPLETPESEEVTLATDGGGLGMSHLVIGLIAFLVGVIVGRVSFAMQQQRRRRNQLFG